MVVAIGRSFARKGPCGDMNPKNDQEHFTEQLERPDSLLPGSATKPFSALQREFSAGRLAGSDRIWALRKSERETKDAEQKEYDYTRCKNICGSLQLKPNLR